MPDGTPELNDLTDFEEQLIACAHAYVNVWSIGGNGVATYAVHTFAVKQNAVTWYDTLPLRPDQCPTFFVSRNYGKRGNLNKSAQNSLRKPQIVNLRRMKRAFEYLRNQNNTGDRYFGTTWDDSFLIGNADKDGNVDYPMEGFSSEGDDQA